jgi:hypothetical protein
LPAPTLFRSAHGTPPPTGVTPEDPDGTPSAPITSEPDDAQVTTTPKPPAPPAPVPAITLEKTVDKDTARQGDTLTYTFHVTNTGNVPVVDVNVTETKFTGSGELSVITCDATTLAVGASTDCTATDVVTAQDVTAGQVDNTAVARGTQADPDDPAKPADGAKPVVSPPSSADVRATVTPTAAIRLTKSVDKTTVKAGDRVTYTFHVANTGNVDLTGVNVKDTKFSGSGELSAVDCPATNVPVGKAIDCTATYTITDQDIVAGGVTNTATAYADGTDKPVESGPSTAKSTPEPDPATPPAPTASATTPAAAAPSATAPAGAPSPAASYSPVAIAPQGILASTGATITGAALLALVLIGLGTAILTRRRAVK